MKLIEIINELKSLAEDGAYTRGKIDWWLMKEEERYKYLCKCINILKAEFPTVVVEEHKSIKKNIEFISLYDKLYEVSEKHGGTVNSHKLINLDKIINEINY